MAGRGRPSRSRPSPGPARPGRWSNPLAPRHVILGHAAALATRRRLDTLVAARLATGWVPVDGRPAGAPHVPPTPLAPDLVVQISSLLEALGRLWAACHLFRRQARRFGVGTPAARLARAQRERRLGALAEQAGDRAAAIPHARLALASCARVGVTRRLRRLHAAAGREPARQPAPRGFATASRACTPPADSTRLWAATERSWVGGHPARPDTRRKTMNGRVQIVGRLPVALSRRVRAAAKRQQVTLNQWLINALTYAVGGPRRRAERTDAP